MTNFKHISIIKYYIIGGCSIIIGYLIFVFIFLLTEDILLSLIANFFVTFLFRYNYYKMLIFKKLNFFNYLIFYILLFILNFIFLNFIQSHTNLYLAQLFYIIIFSAVIYIFLKKWET